MRNTRTKPNMTPRPAGVPVHLPEEVIAEILSRLPGKSVLRFRAVSAAWRRITTDPKFLAAHARRRPLEVVLCNLLEQRPSPGDPTRYSRDLVLDSVPVAAANPADQRRLIRYPSYMKKTQGYESYIGFGNLPRASCAGVLLFQTEHGRYLICNPVTRQWADLPWLPVPQRCSINEYAFYFHQSSGEYRLLCHLKEWDDATAKYYITSTGTAEPRQVSTGDVDEATDEAINMLGHPFEDYITPVALHDRLHWMLPLSTGDRKILAFDTVSETFQPLMPTPPMSSGCVKLFKMNQRLAVANFGRTHIDLWLLEDYDAREWVHRHQIITPPMLTELGDPPCDDELLNVWRITAATSNDGEDVILGQAGSLMVYNVRAKTTRTIDFIRESDPNPGPRLLFRESLMPLAAAPSAGHPMVQFG